MIAGPVAASLVFLSALVLFVNMAVAWRWRKARSAAEYLILLFLLGIYSFTYGLSLLWPDSYWIFLCNVAGRLALFATPIIVLWFIMRFLGQLTLRGRLILSVLSFVPLISIVLLLRYAALSWSDRIAPPAMTLVFYDFMPPVWRFMHHGAALVYVASGVSMLVAEVRSAGRLLRRQLLVLAAAFVLAILAQVLFHPSLANLLRLPWLPMPMFLSLSGFIGFWGLFHSRLFRVMPVVRTVLFEKLKDPIFVVDENGRIIDSNGAALANFGRSAVAEGLNLAASVLFVAETWQRFSASKERSYFGEAVDMANQRYYQVQIDPVEDRHNVCLAYMLFLRDITERKQIEQQLAEEHQKLEARMRQAEKLESIGLLAGGIAHDFNNLLTGIFGYIELARLSAGEGQLDDVTSALGQLTPVFNRARDLTKQLLTFAKGSLPLTKLGDFGPQLKKAVDFALSGSKIRVEYSIDADLWPVSYDSSQLGQVLDNLVINAKQAMPAGGTLTVTASNLQLAPEDGLQLPAGTYIKISLADSGGGIPPDILPRIFEPFFTTKQSGSGLGLATCYSIIRKHNGLIEASSVPGQGTVFNIYLPATPGSCVGDCGDSVAAQDVVRLQGLALVLDDEAYIQTILSRMLLSFGLRVESFAAAADLLERVGGMTQAERAELRLAVLDLTIPGEAGGAAIVADLKRLRPGLACIAASGYAEDPVIARPADFGFDASIGKPYLVDDLLGIVRRLTADGLA